MFTSHLIKLKTFFLIIAIFWSINCFSLVAFLDVGNNVWRDNKTPNQKSLERKGEWHVIVLTNMQSGRYYEFKVADEKTGDFSSKHLWLEMKNIQKGSKGHFQEFRIDNNNGIISFKLANDAPNDISISFDVVCRTNFISVVDQLTRKRMRRYVSVGRIGEGYTPPPVGVTFTFTKITDVKKERDKVSSSTTSLALINDLISIFERNVSAIPLV